MPDISVRVRVLRERAEELRAIAEDWSSQDTQRILMGLASDYERIANLLEGAIGAD